MLPLLSPASLRRPRNDGAGHADQDAEGTKSESDADFEKQFDESTGKKRKYSAYLKYTEVKRWSTGKDSVMERHWSLHKSIMKYTVVVHSHEVIYASAPVDEGSGPARESD